MKRGLSLLFLEVLSRTAAAQTLTPPDYTKASVVKAAKYCLETFREGRVNARRFPIEEFAMPVCTKDDATNAFKSCVLYRLANGNVGVVPLT